MALTAFIDLTEKKVTLQKTPEEIAEKFLSCRGYAARLLYDLVPPSVEPLSPDNYLIYSTGLFTGTQWPTSARYMVTTKSPLTGAYGYANASGFFGPELKKAGFDALVITGKAREPVLIKAEDGQVEILDGSQYWGAKTSVTETGLKEKFPGCRVSSIGPAGENLVRFASIINDYGRAAARCGVGAVMGSKNLKAVVARSTEKKKADAKFKEVAIKYNKHVGQHPNIQGLRRWGTPMLMDSKNVVGDQPTRNHLQAQFAGNNRVNAKALDKYVEKSMACYACPIRCSKYSKVKSGKYATEIEGPEYETLNALGPMCGNSDPESIIYGNRLCNDLGMDTISTGVVIAFAMECFEKGILTDPDLSLEWGDSQSILGLIEKIASRQGLGKILAEGVQRAARVIGQGAENYALHVKGMELPRQEPRVAKAFGLGHAVSNRGADHLYALPTIDLAGLADVARKLFPDIYPEIMEVTSEKHKGRMIKYTEAYNAIADALGVCKFSTTEIYCLYPEDLAQGLQKMGFDLDGEKLLEIGERIVNLERMYNVRQGLNRKDDQLPRRFLEEPLNVYAVDTDSEGNVVFGEPVKEGLLIKLPEMLDEYYEVRGWQANGLPTPEKLRELGLEDLVKDLPLGQEGGDNNF